MEKSLVEIYVCRDPPLNERRICKEYKEMTEKEIAHAKKELQELGDEKEQLDEELMNGPAKARLNEILAKKKQIVKEKNDRELFIRTFDR